MLHSKASINHRGIFSCAIFHINTAIFLIKGRVSDQLDVQSWLRKLILHWGSHFPVECKGSETPVSWNTNLRSTVCSFLVLFTIACLWAPPIEGLLRMACVSPCSPGYFAVPSGIGCNRLPENDFWLPHFLQSLHDKIKCCDRMPHLCQTHLTINPHLP